MRTVVISDVHGNLAALDAVLRSIEAESYDKVVFLGDLAATGPEPHSVIAKLRAVYPVCVMGNTDEWLLRPVARVNPEPEAKMMEDIDFWCASQLTDSDRDFLRSFQHMTKVDIGGGATLLAYHGSPKSNREGVPPAGTASDLEAVLLGERATVMAGGHLHVQMLRRYQDSTLINPGSVGLPFQRDPSTGKTRIPPWCEYAVVRSEGGRLDVAFRRVPLDPDEVASSVLGSNMPHKNEFLETWASLIGKLTAQNKSG